MRPALSGLTPAQLQEAVIAVGGKSFQARQIEHWLFKHGAEDWADFKNLPSQLLDRLAEGHAPRAGALKEQERSSDGTRKLLIGFTDDETVEAVLIPEGERNTLCISTQVGCPVACVFCASGLGGVRRNLNAGEILEQVLLAKGLLGADQALTNIVVMGMGEPLLNLDALLMALERLHDPDGINLGARRITVSTSGYPKQMERFAKEAPHAYNLAVSLHAGDDQLRQQLVPTAQASVSEIVDAASEFFGAKGREVTFEVVLLAGTNDRPQDAKALATAIGTLPCTINLIPWNPVDEISGLSRPSDHHVDRFADSLRQLGLKVTVRRQRGADKSAACGQLRLAHLP